MVGTDYVVAFDALVNDLNERSSAIRLKIDTAQAHHQMLKKQFHLGQLDAIQAIRSKLSALRSGKTEAQIKADWQMKPVVTHGKLTEDLFQLRGYESAGSEE